MDYQNNTTILVYKRRATVNLMQKREMSKAMRAVESRYLNIGQHLHMLPSRGVQFFGHSFIMRPREGSQESHTSNAAKLLRSQKQFGAENFRNTIATTYALLRKNRDKRKNH
ncbi:unnamed protein product [Ceratitis capitata]|uniref:(Mediterranean fruit fly) hypothetical protein n=1 Tax=Ceratitis capitata TaxID=7213 RepID=A0A811V4Y6_CERCA|nr:unnamed protein product [Ceratitis capitata]